MNTKSTGSAQALAASLHKGIDRMVLDGCMIGAGFFARHHIDAWRRIEGVRMVAVVDRDASRAEAFAQEHGIARWYADAQAMLESEPCAFVDIVTRPDSHAALVRLAAAHGKAILCQKPFARSLAEARDLVAYCTERGVRLMVNENWRWQPWYREMKRLLHSGCVGEVHHVRCVVRPGDGAGDNPFPNQPYFRSMEKFLIQETLIHFLDTLLFLFGPVERVYCRTRRLNPVLAGEDFALIMLDFRSGATGLIDANRYAGEKVSETFGRMTVEGSKGSLKLGLDGKLEFIDLQGERRVHPYPRPRLGYRGDSCKRALEHFIHALRARKPFETEGASYLTTLALVEACYRSAKERAAVTVNPP